LCFNVTSRLHASRIDCLEIDEAYEQAVENFENTPWSDVYFVFMRGLDEFVRRLEDEYLEFTLSQPLL
jgi:tRNA1Val (adenine37-N6)-methyltransferase